MNRNILIAVVVVVVLIGGGLFLMNRQPATSSNKNATTTDNSGQNAPVTSPVTDTTTSSESDTTSTGEMEGVKEFTVTGANYKFEPATLNVNQGDKVKITFKSADGIHDFTIDDLNIQTKQVTGGQEAVIEFTADKAGSFEYYCSVGNHKAMGMKGALVVQ